MTISDFLKRGESEAVHLMDLCRLTGASPTCVKAAVRRSRLDGIPIVSSVSGYWLAASEAEIKGFTKMMQAQGNSRLEVAEAVNNAGGIEDG